MTQDIIGVDFAKRVFQLHGSSADGSVVFRRKLSRGQLLEFLADQPRMLVAIALANSERRCAAGSSTPRTARAARAMLTEQEDYRPPAAA